MDNIKKFEDFLDRMQGLLDNAKKQGHIIVRVEDLENAFPELAESEGEKIRKILVEFFKSYKEQGNCGAETFNGIPTDNILAWLEKQDKERKITYEDICKSYGIQDIGDFSDGYHTFNGLYKQRMILFAVLVKTYKNRAWKSWKHEDGEKCFGGGWFIVGIDTPAGTYTYHYEAKDWDKFDCQVLEKAKHWDGHNESDVERLFSLIESQGQSAQAVREEKADKIEPKFKVGDWVVTKGLVLKIQEVRNDLYETILQNDELRIFDTYILDNDAHLWTIQDARDGDVLTAGNVIFIFNKIHDVWINCHCSLFKDNSFVNRGYDMMHIKYSKESVYPATKEQRDTLFKAMADAGYTPSTSIRKN